MKDLDLEAQKHMDPTNLDQNTFFDFLKFF